MNMSCLSRRFYRKELGSEAVIEVFFPKICKNLLIFVGAKAKRMYGNPVTSAGYYK